MARLGPSERAQSSVGVILARRSAVVAGKPVNPTPKTSARALALTHLAGCLSLLWIGACSPPRPREQVAEQSEAETDNGSTLALLPHSDGGTSTSDEFTAECGPGPDPDASFSKKNLLRSVAACAQLRYCEFGATAEALSDAATAYAEDSTEERLLTLAAAYQASMERWSRAELFQFGPAASVAKDMENGQGLRDLIYSWPNVSRCRVEEQLFGRAYVDAGFDDLIQVPINARGLFAVEYLAFYGDVDNDCGRFSITNEGDAWASTDPSELERLKLDYLAAVANDVAKTADKLQKAWDPKHGDFESQLVSASAYMDQQQALNIVAHGLVYVDLEVRDYKVGAPAQLYEDAPLERPESSFVGGATQLVAENLAGFRDLFQGCGGEGLGFDDWLVEAGHEDLAQDILSHLDDVDEAVAGFPELNVASTEELVALHAVMKQLTDAMKSELFGQGSPLGLTLPTGVEGDTD